MDKFINQWRKLEKAKEDNQEVEPVKQVAQGESAALFFDENTPDNDLDTHQSTPTSTSTSTSSRKYLAHWHKTYQWIWYDGNVNKVFCSVCKRAFIELNIKRPTTGFADEMSYAAFVDNGFSNWKKAIERFKSHETSTVHRHAVHAILSKKSRPSVLTLISTQSTHARKDARHCLIKIFESIRFLAIQGLAIRGHCEENSNFIQLLHLRSNDDATLKAWLERTQYKWISHDIIAEVLSLMSLNVQRQLQKEISKYPFYAIMVDETSDVSKKEQMSINIRFVDERLNICERFLGFYECVFTDAETLFEIVSDALQRFQLSYSKCRGQCYDGASNVSGWISGLQTRIRERDFRALYIHCAGHNLNLSSQDAMCEVQEMADLLSNMKSLVTFIKASPKRVQIFKNIQCQFTDDDDDKAPCEIVSLKQFCPTRWCVRVKSLKSIRTNYKFILDFCDQVGSDKKDAEAGVKARGFSSYLNKFETYLMLEIAIATLEPLEELNETLQATTINFRSVIRRVNILKASVEAKRSNIHFDAIWNSTDCAVKLLDLDDKVPTIPRIRKMPKRFDESSTAHFPSTPKDKYRPVYFGVIDQILTSLNDRFDSETYEILGKLEDFATRSCEFEDIAVRLYKNGNCDFDKDRLVLHRNMFFDVVKQKNLKLKLKLTSISIFLQKNDEYRELFSEYTKFIQQLLTYPQTVCIAERSFSGLKRLKTPLRGNMTQKTLNDFAVLHIHKKITSSIDIDDVANEFILRGGSVRGNAFEMKGEN